MCPIRPSWSSTRRSSGWNMTMTAMMMKKVAFLKSHERRTRLSCVATTPMTASRMRPTTICVPCVPRSKRSSRYSRTATTATSINSMTPRWRTTSPNCPKNCWKNCGIISRFRAGRAQGASLEKLGHQRHLRVEAVARLLKHDRARSIDDLIGHLFPAMRRETVHEHRAGRGIHQRLVDLVFRKCVAPLVTLAFLSHGCPYVGVDRCRGLQTREVARERDLQLVGADGTRAVEHGSLRVVAGR